MWMSLTFASLISIKKKKTNTQHCKIDSSHDKGHITQVYFSRFLVEII